MNRIELLQQQIPNKSCALITSDVNRRYFSGMKSSAGTIIVFPEQAYLIIDFRYIEKARETAQNCEVILQERLYDQLNKLIKKHDAHSLMIENETMTVADLDRLYDRIDPDVDIDSGDTLSGIITDMRAIKTPEEISMMTKAQRIAEAALENTLNFIKEGVTEKEIALSLNEYMLRNGAEDLSFETIALCGETTSMPHGVPSDKPLKSGEFILMDFGAVYNGYHSDMTRTVVLGEPTEEMEKVYNTVLEAQEKAIFAAKAGITGVELDKIARDYINSCGYEGCFGHGLGHSVGMEIHESPCANTRDETVFAENMIVTVEPGIYLPKKFGVRIEDFVVIKQNSCVNLTNAPKKLIKL